MTSLDFWKQKPHFLLPILNLRWLSSTELYILQLYILQFYILQLYILQLYTLQLYTLQFYILQLYILQLYILQLYILQLYTLQLYILQLYILQLYILQFYVLHFTSYNFTSYNFTSYNFTSYNFTSYNFTSYNFTSYNNSTCRQIREKLEVEILDFIILIYFFPMARQPLGVLGNLIIEASRSHSDTPHSVGLLWTSDQPVAETSTWQHTTLKTNRHLCPRRDSNPQSQ
jgi:hypothetical protein